jgi:hypothetical protein
LESDQDSILYGHIKERQSRSEAETKRQTHPRLTSSTFEDDELPFQEGFLLKEEDVPPSQDRLYRKLHAQCFLHPKFKHSTFQCINLRKALGAPPPPNDEGASAH